jgi:hypothetical protein
VPSRRDRKKAEATPTPLAALATGIPEREADFDAAEIAATAPPAHATMPAPELEDDMLPESTATMPVVGPEIDTAPANVRSRPGARKIATRTEIDDVPRTIAEMQARDEVGTVFVTDEAEEAEPLPPEPLFVSPQALIIGVLLPFAVLTVIPTFGSLLCRLVGASDTVYTAVNFVCIAVASIIALMMGVRNWQTAFHDMPTDLHPRAVLELWFTRTPRDQRDLWNSVAKWIVGGFVFLLLFFLIIAPFTLGLRATYFIPFFLVGLFGKGVSAFLFVGYFERGALTLSKPNRAALITGVLYGGALAIANCITIALNSPSQFATAALPYIAISLVVGLSTAWIRLRSGSLAAAISFELLLVLLQFGV